MSKVKVYPKVLLVGRTNVGKSTLFNRLAKDAQSIVSPEEGVTRDYLQETITWADKTFDLIDTGGISLKKQKDPILEKVRQKVLELFDEAALILFVCDGKVGLTPEDQELAKNLHQTKKPLVLILNKSDNVKVFEENLPDFYKLGIKEILAISAIHGKGIADLLEKIVDIIPKPKISTEIKKPIFKIAFLGKPNVGKSSLMNLMLKKERSIVHEEAGTTREAIAENIYFSQDIKDIAQLIDTAGIRRKRKIKQEDIESLMVKSSLAAVRQSDIILLLVDVSEHKISDQELKLLFYAYEQKKSIILIFNKTDLLNEQERKNFEFNLKPYDFILKKVPIVWTSCKTKKNVDKIFKEISKAWERRNQEFDIVEINELIKNELLKKPMFHKTNPIKISKITPIKFKIPTFEIKVNHPEWMGETQLGFIENILRKHYDLKGCPIKFNLKKSR